MRMRIVAVTLATAGLTALGLLTAGATADASGHKLSQHAAAKKFRAAHVTWSSSGHCTNRRNPHCTSFAGIRSGTVHGVITLKRAGHCKINITGGTEVGHAAGTYSHYHGYKVDIAHNGCVDRYVKRSFTYIGHRGDGYPQWRAPSGNLYCDEGSHWDITYF